MKNKIESFKKTIEEQDFFADTVHLNIDGLMARKRFKLLAEVFVRSCRILLSCSYSLCQ